VSEASTHLFLHDTPHTGISTLSLHDALPISSTCNSSCSIACAPKAPRTTCSICAIPTNPCARPPKRPCAKSLARSPWTSSCTKRSEEHTSELQSRENLVCRLLLEKKNKDARA